MREYPKFTKQPGWILDRNKSDIDNLIKSIRPNERHKVNITYALMNMGNPYDVIPEPPTIYTDKNNWLIFRPKNCKTCHLVTNTQPGPYFYFKNASWDIYRKLATSCMIKIITEDIRVNWIKYLLISTAHSCSPENVLLNDVIIVIMNKLMISYF